eukprot:scaffold3598_cov139-Skeletonema_menzelii.AAC.6
MSSVHGGRQHHSYCSVAALPWTTGVWMMGAWLLYGTDGVLSYTCWMLYFARDALRFAHALFDYLAGNFNTLPRNCFNVERILDR